MEEKTDDEIISTIVDMLQQEKAIRKMINTTDNQQEQNHGKAKNTSGKKGKKKKHKKKRKHKKRQHVKKHKVRKNKRDRKRLYKKDHVERITKDEDDNLMQENEEFSEDNRMNDE